MSINLSPLSFDYALDASTDLFLGNSTDIIGLQSEANNKGACSSKALNEATPWLATRERFRMFAGLVTILGLLRSCRTARDSLENMIIEAQRHEAESGEGTYHARPLTVQNQPDRPDPYPTGPLSRTTCTENEL